MARSFLLEDVVPLLTLSGPGGVGKTRLALAIAQDSAPQFAEGIVFVDLSPLIDPRLVGTTVAAALGMTAVGDHSLTDAIVTQLRPAQRLLVLDNCEHVLVAVAELVAALLAGCPAVQVIATSRAPLRVRGEQILVVNPLPLPGRLAGSLAAIASNEAVQLFVERAQATAPRFRLTEVNAAAVASLCRRLDGLPLAIELTAARTSVLSAEAVLAHLTDHLDMPGVGLRDLPARQQTLSATLSWSYSLLDSRAQALFRRLAIFVGGCTLDAAKAVAGWDNSGQDVVAGLAALVDLNLVHRLEREDEARYTMLETIRALGLEQLSDPHEAKTARDAHAAYYLAFAERAAPMLLTRAAPDVWLDRLTADHGNLRAALAWRCDGETPQDCLRLAAASAWFWYRRGYVAEGRSRLHRALADAGLEPTVARGRALFWAAALAIRAGDPAAATPLAQDALAVWESIGDPIGRAMAMYGIARVEKHQGRWEAAIARFAEALAVWRTIGDPGSIGMVLIELGEIAFAQGELAKARVLMTESARYLQVAEEKTWLAATDLYLGLFAVAEGQFTEAARRFRACLAGYAATGDAFVQSPLAGLARVAIEVGHPVAAAQLVGFVDTELQRTGMRFDRAEQSGRNQAEAGARAALGEAAFAAAHVAGRTISRDVWFAVADEIVTAAEAADGSLQGQTRTIVASGGPPMCSADDRFQLSPREREVLALLYQRLSDAEIGEILSISPRTASRHVANLFNKLGVSSRRQAAALAAQHRLI